VDLDEGTLTVRVSRPKLASGEMIEKDPKTKAGNRVIAIPPHILEPLRDHLDRFVGPEPDAYLLTGEQGQPLHPGTFYKNWDRARRVIGRPTLRPHDLRHTGLTLYAQTGATTAELMHRAGHDSPAAALRYQHATLERDRAGAEALSELA
jgi:integrase